MTEPTVDKVQELQDKVEVLERNFKYVKDVLAFEKQRYRDLEREVGRFENNFKYLQGVLDADDRYISELKGLLRKLYHLSSGREHVDGKQVQELYVEVEKMLGEPA
jgi:hypothetical protein